MQVEELLSKKSIEYREQGRDYLVRCFNPQHEDRNPSMRIDKITGIFHCLACGFRGEIFKHFGEKPNLAQIRREKLKQKILSKLSESIGLITPSSAMDYEGDWRGISPKTYKKFGAFESPDTSFVGRIVFPIKDLSGITVAFVGRHTTMGHSPKYMIFPAQAKMPLFPVVTPIQGKVILVEGIFDMLNLHDKGLDNAVCTFGTRTLNEDKLGLLKMQGVTGIDLLFDADEAGKSASTTAEELAERVGLTVRNIELSHNDPGSLTENAIRKLKEKLYG
jgi:DNA primase